VVIFRVSNPHPFNPDPGFEIFADIVPNPEFEIFSDPD